MKKKKDKKKLTRISEKFGTDISTFDSHVFVSFFDCSLVNLFMRERNQLYIFATKKKCY